jgi:hypothetical protein
VNDNQNLLAVYDTNYSNRFYGNTIVKRPGAAVTVFTNGGRGFVRGTDEPQQGIATDDRWNPRAKEVPEVRNRMLYSEDISNAAWTKSNVSVSGGSCNQTDPLAGSTACKLTHSTSNSDFIQATVNNTNLTTNVVVGFWAKQGTTSDLTAVVYDVTQSLPVCVFPVTLSSIWKEYKNSCGGLNTGNTFRLYFYPDLGSSSVSGDFYLWGVQVQDYDGPYHKTAGSVYVDTTEGSEFSRKVRLASIVSAYNNVSTAGIGVIPVYGTFEGDTQSASIATATLYAVPSDGAGTYRLCFYGRISRAATSSSSLTMTIGWTDGGVAQSQNSTAVTGNTTTSQTNGCALVYADASTNLTYATTYASSGATTMQYRVRFTAERLK